MFGSTPTTSIFRTAGPTSSRRFSTTSSTGISPRRTWQRRSDAHLTFTTETRRVRRFPCRTPPALHAGETPALRDPVVHSDLQMYAGVEQHGGIGPIAHTKGLGACETGQRDLARRRLPSLCMRLFPA